AMVFVTGLPSSCSDVSSTQVCLAMAQQQSQCVKQQCQDGGRPPPSKSRGFEVGRHPQDDGLFVFSRQPCSRRRPEGAAMSTAADPIRPLPIPATGEADERKRRQSREIRNLT